MDQNPDVIRHHIEETRSALTDKLETLENEVLGTVREATSAVTSTVRNVKDTVASTVENVKETVQGTVRSVKQTFDVRLQVERHPWALVGGSFAAGLLLGNLLPPERGKGGNRTAAAAAAPFSTPRPERPPAGGPSVTGVLGNLVEQFAPELQKVKGMAIGLVAGLVRDALKEQIPEPMVADFEELVNNFTAKLGGEPVHGPILETPTVGGDVSSYRQSAFAERSFRG
jgi:ElaB/YqjD/DUF883 family membrane-anchored ribosome-binding protein